MPRFLTLGAGSIWVLNQGDGTIARVDASRANDRPSSQRDFPGTAAKSLLVMVRFGRVS